MIRSTTIVCPDCCGSGQVFIDEHTVEEEIIEETEIKVIEKCLRCKGEGLIEEEDEEDL